MTLEFDAKSQNEVWQEIAVASFLTEIDPTIEEINDIKKREAPEAITNSIVHLGLQLSGVRYNQIFIN